MQTVNTQSVHISEEYIDHNQLLVYGNTCGVYR